MEHVDVATDIRCPGCHFQCRLTTYQCGRGREFYELAASGEPLPERRGPMLSPSERAAGKGMTPPPIDLRVMHALNIVSHILQHQHEEAAERKIVLTLEHNKGFMSPKILSKRTQLAGKEFDAALEAGAQAGLFTRDEEPHTGAIVRLSEAGREQAELWKVEREQANAEFLSPLSEGERAELESLLRRLIPKP